MHSKMPLLAALALLILVETDANSPSPPPAQSSRPSSAKPAVESNDTLIVVLKHGYTAFSCAPFQDIVKRVGPAAGDKYPFGAFRITDSSVSSATALQRIQACPEVADVTWDLELEKNTIDIVTLHPTPTAPGRRIHQTRTTAPDDPLYTDMGSWAHEAMSTLQAWGTSEGTATIPICMVDTGLLPSHPDLQDNLWVNTGEIPGDGIDNDGNGFVDDVHGVHINTLLHVYDNDITDQVGHGTHIAGILAGTVNNGLGTAGHAPGSRIMTCKAGTPYRGPQLSEMIECYKYCHRMGARIMTTSSGSCTTSATSASMMATIFDHFADTMFVFSAGNNGIALPSPLGCGFPGRLSLNRGNVVNIGSANWNYVKSTFSNYGPKLVQAAAPGEYILSTSYTGSYVIMQGTSMAAPHVAAVFAMLKGYNHTLTPPQMRDVLKYGCTPLTNGASQFTCGGMVHAAKSMNFCKAIYPAKYT